MKVFRAFFILLISVCSVFADSDLKSFDAANALYAKEDYANAILMYTDLLEHSQSASAHYNLANSYFKTGQYGYAVLHYKKSLALDPHAADAKANLRLCYEKAEVVNIMEGGFLEMYGHILSLNAWIWSAVVSFWFFVFCVVLPRYFGGRNVFTSLGSVLSLFVFLSVLPAFFYYYGASNEAVILQADAPLRVAPAIESPVAAYLQPGVSVLLEDERNDFIYVVAISGKRGWLKKGECESVWQID